MLPSFRLTQLLDLSFLSFLLLELPSFEFDDVSSDILLIVFLITAAGIKFRICFLVGPSELKQVHQIRLGRIHWLFIIKSIELLFFFGIVVKDHLEPLDRGDLGG